MTRSLLADAFEHHVWATLRLIDACRGLTDEELGTVVHGTYGSILDTVRHIVGADASYLATLTDGRVPRIDEDRLDLSQLREVMERHAREWPAILAGNLDPERVVVRRRDDGSESHAPLGVRLAQVIHHGTDHRSQVCTALTAVGIEPPAIDVWDYAEQDGRLVEVAPPVGEALERDPNAGS